ncbi:MAG: hypothetical protein D6790_02875, partial [Caldilineae bacterium]
MRPYARFLSDELARRIIDEAFRVLEVHGVHVHHPGLRARMEQAGFRVEHSEELLFIRRDQAEAALGHAPEQAQLFTRESALHVTLGGDQVHFTPASSALFILDHRTGYRRKATTADLADYARVVNGLAHITYPSTAFSTVDVPQSIADAWRLYVLLAHGPRPPVSGAFTPHGVPVMGEIMQLFRRDRDDLRSRPLALFTICPTSPLRWNEDSSQNLLDCIEWGIPVEFVPVQLMGL